MAPPYLIQLFEFDGTCNCHQVFGIFFASICLGDVHPEVLHQALKVLLQQVFPGNLQDGQGHQEYGLDALKQKHVQDSEHLENVEKNLTVLSIS